MCNLRVTKSDSTEVKSSAVSINNNFGFVTVSAADIGTLNANEEFLNVLTCTANTDTVVIQTKTKVYDAQSK